MNLIGAYSQLKETAMLEKTMLSDLRILFISLRQISLLESTVDEQIDAVSNDALERWSPSHS